MACVPKMAPGRAQFPEFHQVAAASSETLTMPRCGRRVRTQRPDRVFSMEVGHV